MRFHPLPIVGAFRIDVEPVRDERGFFARAFSEDEFAAAGLPSIYPQASLSHSERRGTLRGLHYRLDGREAKLIRCVAGAVFDVLVDMRPDSASYLHWHGLELSAANRSAVFVPPGCAHGHQALTEGAELYYQMSDLYAPEEERGLRWDDPAFAIAWPLTPTIISTRDEGFPDYEAVSPPAAVRSRSECR